MGHQRLGKLPTTRAWQAIVALVTGGADAAQVAAAVSRVAEPALAAAADDPALRLGFWVLTQIPLAAREPSLSQALHRLGMDVVDQPTLIEIGAATMAVLDDVIVSDRRSNDLSDMVAATVVESLVSVAGRDEDTLFGNIYKADQARASLRKLASPAQFAVLVRDFIARLTREHLGYYLSRSLPEQVGQSKRFQSLRDHHEFEAALTLHCREAALIVEQFASEWYGKHIFEDTLTPKTAAGFAHVAFAKVRDELRVRGETSRA